MRILSKGLVAILITCVTVLSGPMPVAGQEQITRISPKIRLSPQEELPVRTETKVSGWTWVVLALLAAGGAAAMAGGGGGGGSGASTSVPAASTTSGNATVHW